MHSLSSPQEYLEVLRDISCVRCAFVERVGGVSVSTDRAATVLALEPMHQQVVRELGGHWNTLWRAEQTHGDGIAVIDAVRAKNVSDTIKQVDGLITDQPGMYLGIYVADCGAVYILDKKSNAIGLVHSGKKGTELNIIGKAIEMMQKRFGSAPEDLIVTLAPCIRPPHYEVDFAAQIKKQALATGVLEENYVDSGHCTAENVHRYYSYRVEKGGTGRMLAILGTVEPCDEISNGNLR